MLYKLSAIKRICSGRVVLDIENLEIEKGLIYSLSGPNGAGKTTLLRLLAFLDRPDQGNIEMEGEEVRYQEKTLVTLRRKAVLLDQHPIMFSGTVLANVEFGMRMRGLPRKDRYRRSMEMLEMIGMDHFAERDASGLSGGEVKRVALARALVLKPKVLLCDEPTANVDKEHKEIILHTIKTLNKSRQTSIVFATHYQSQAQRLAQQTLFLQYGILTKSPYENSFRCTVLEHHETGMKVTVGKDIILQLESAGSWAHGDIGQLFIDPEKITIGSDAANQSNSLCGTVEEMSLLNDTIRLVVDVGIRLVLLISRKQYRTIAPHLDQQILLTLPHEALRFFGMT